LSNVGVSAETRSSATRGVEALLPRREDGPGLARAARMNLPRLVVIAVVVASAPSRADEPAAAPPFVPTWSLGAGLTLGSQYFGGLLGTGGLGVLGGLGTLTYAYPGIAPNVSIERAFSSRFALGLGLEAAVGTSTTVGSTLPAPTAVSVNLGVSPRFTLTPRSAPVAFTVFATVFAGYSTFSYPVTEDRTTSSKAFSLGAAGGMALEKRFLERLAVRVQAQLVRLGFVRTWATLPTVPGPLAAENSTVNSSFNASLIPSPSIELRLYLD
jgi:hypothetical protein